MKSSLAVACLICLFVASSTRSDDSPSNAQLAAAEETALKAAARKVAPSVVRIETLATEATGENDGAGPTSGLIVTADGHIVASGYAFGEKPASILVTLADGKRLAGRIVARDLSRNLVLLKIDAGDKLPIAEAAPKDEISVGAWAVAAGRTFDGTEVNLSAGIVSATGRIWGRAIQTDAKISASNYGGPLVDVRGRVLGVLTPMSPTESGERAGADWYDSGIGFAVPLADLIAVLPKMQSGKDLRGGLAGISFSGTNIYTDPPIIAACRAKSPAAKAGLVAQDRIVEADGKPINRLVQLRHVLGPRYAGDRVKLVVARGDQRLPVELDLAGELPPFEHPFLGLLPFRDAGDGLFVRYVYPGSPAEKAAVQPGDRIDSLGGKEVKSPKAALAVLNAQQVGDRLAVVVTRNGKRHELSAELTTLPTAVPSMLPPARRTAGEKKSDAENGLVPIQVPEFKNQAQALVPATYDRLAPVGLVIVLVHPAAAGDDTFAQRWRQTCETHGLIALAVKSADRTAWQPGETEFIVKAVASLAAKYRIDPSRVVAFGQASAGTTAYQLAFSQRTLVRGVVTVDAPPPPLAEPPENDAALRLAVLAATSSGSPGAARIEAGVKRLAELRHPVTKLDLGANPRGLTSDELSTVGRWIDALDRF
jgi:serine protease Do